MKTRPRAEVRLYYGPHPTRRPSVLIGSRRTAANGSTAFDFRLPVGDHPAVLYELTVDGAPFRFSLHGRPPHAGELLLTLPPGQPSALVVVGRRGLPGHALVPVRATGVGTTYALERRLFYRVRLGDGTPLYLRFV